MFQGDYSLISQQEESTHYSLNDALQQARETAARLDREMQSNTKLYQAAYLQGASEQKH